MRNLSQMILILFASASLILTYQNCSKPLQIPQITEGNSLNDICNGIKTESPNLDVFGGQEVVPGSEQYDIGSSLFINVNTIHKADKIVWELSKNDINIDSSFGRSNTYAPNFDNDGTYIITATGSIEVKGKDCEFFRSSRIVQIVNPSCTESFSSPNIALFPNRSSFHIGDQVSASISNLSNTNLDTNSLKWTLEIDSNNSGNFSVRKNLNGSAITLKNIVSEIDTDATYRLKVEANRNTNNPNCTGMEVSEYIYFTVRQAGSTEPDIINISVSPNAELISNSSTRWAYRFIRNASTNSINILHENISTCHTRGSANTNPNSNCTNWNILVDANDSGQNNCFIYDDLELHFTGTNGQTISIDFFLHCALNSSQCTFGERVNAFYNPEVHHCNTSNLPTEITSFSLQNTTNSNSQGLRQIERNGSNHDAIFVLQNADSCNYRFDNLLSTSDDSTSLTHMANNGDNCSRIEGIDTYINDTHQSCRLVELEYNVQKGNAMDSKNIFIHCPQGDNICSYGTMAEDYNSSIHNCPLNPPNCFKDTAMALTIKKSNDENLSYASQNIRYANQLRSFNVVNNLQLVESEEHTIRVTATNTSASTACLWNPADNFKLGVGGESYAYYEGSFKSIADNRFFTANIGKWSLPAGSRIGTQAPNNSIDFDITIKAPANIDFHLAHFSNSGSGAIPENRVYLPLNFQMMVEANNSNIPTGWFGDQIRALGSNSPIYIAVEKSPLPPSEYCAPSTEFDNPIQACSLPEAVNGTTVRGNCGFSYPEQDLDFEGSCSYTCIGNNQWVPAGPNTCEFHFF